MEHPGLSWLGGSSSGRRWLERLPGLVAACAETWGLEVGDPYPLDRLTSQLDIDGDRARRWGPT